MMRLKASQVLFIISAIAFLLGNVPVGMALLFFGMAVMMFDFLPRKKEEDEKEKEIIKPLE